MGYNKGNGSNGGNRGRSYGLMLLLAFGAALLGIMILHKLRERRIFNLLVKEKDHELLSLHLLLQKEKDHIQDVKRKNEEMKAKIYALRTRKMELDRKLLEMQSTIDSLKDEQRTMEVAFEEKQSEIKLLRLKEINVGTTADQSDQNSQMTALIESLKQKDAEIEDLKHRLLHYPVQVWSVSSDDPSNPSVNLTVTAESGEKTMTGSEEGSGNISVTKEGETKRVGGIENRVEEDSNMREMMDKKVQRIEDGNSKRNENEATSDNRGKVIDLKTVDGEGFETKRNGQLGKVDDPQGKGQELLWNSKGNNAWSTMRGKHGSMSNTKGKRWKLIAKNRRLENRNLKNNGVPTSMRSRKFYEDDSKGRVKVAAFNGGLVGDDHSVEVTQAVDSSGAKGPDAIDNIRQNNTGKINMAAKDNNEVSENLKVADDVHEQGKHAGNGDFFSKFGSTSEQDREEYKEEMDETEF
ncbi:hypothetical protein FNV43_RR13539 [Rhamnella rubrinervis]|uniref:Uncharacterized protein n=1 Tax=Rhamnella rubrinervis TaxID=2594499 RepID=A0A8K0H1A1_9ROSA|nr:hypothetical protein FNV43_RR13539 [Rhamnella rubrinervis]